MKEDPRVVLIVEDEVIVAMDLKLQAEDAGWQVLGPVGTIAEAQAVVADHQPDCALLDVNLVDENSFELAEGLRRRGTRVVFLTGLAASDIPDEMRELPVVEKPVRYADLMIALSEPG
ncbi:response regulator [Roseisalinus antarcticus]|uniref:Putative transcriptional regulatory protein pdtaR n=1 Tax=Roseisalinus antarcticus TaxID=254357 RepID=A0A1Y5TWS4_9RHOB|nr:response regulator [Roseisalinus antarcticus]SLN75611.1 putative transcriptional regulatory protein pdtaR [Roseisalinus antarcticus]